MDLDNKTKARRPETCWCSKQKGEPQKWFQANVAFEKDAVTHRKQIIVRLHVTVTQNKRL